MARLGRGFRAPPILRHGLVVPAPFTLTNNAEGGSDGTVVTTANSGGGSGRRSPRSSGRTSRSRPTSHPRVRSATTSRPLPMSRSPRSPCRPDTRRRSRDGTSTRPTGRIRSRRLGSIMPPVPTSATSLSRRRVRCRSATRRRPCRVLRRQSIPQHVVPAEPLHFSHASAGTMALPHLRRALHLAHRDHPRYGEQYGWCRRLHLRSR